MAYRMRQLVVCVWGGGHLEEHAKQRGAKSVAQAAHARDEPLHCALLVCRRVVGHI
jgi:hypothetical protein